MIIDILCKNKQISSICIIMNTCATLSACPGSEIASAVSINLFKAEKICSVLPESLSTNSSL